MSSVTYEKLTLPNGLQVILHEDHSLPVTAVNVWYHVGSKDEEIGRTGFAHLFEHVMFEGSKNHNSSFFEPLQKVGASLNGSTTPDRTNYWENVPSNYLELALWLESDRMGYLLDALDQKRFDIQRDVVKNERRQSYENRPYGMAYLALQPLVFPSPHPYSWPTIGSQEDLDAADLDDIKDFFRKYYAPSNASLSIAGDIDPDKVKKLVERYFGDLPPGPPINRTGRMDSSLTGRVEMSIRDAVQLPRVYLVWPTGPNFDEHQAPLDLLTTVLADGKSSRLERKLVYDKQTARDVRMFHHGQEIAGEFFVQVTANPGISLDELENDVMEELERVKREPPSEREMQRARNRIENQHIHQLERVGGFGGRADIMNYYNTFAGDPGLINTDLDRYLRVSADDITASANAVLGDACVRLSVLPQSVFEVSSTTLDRALIPAGAASPQFTPPVPNRARLTNGLEIVYVEKPGTPVTAFGMMVRAGAITDEANKPGLANMTAAMLVEGTSNRTGQEIAEEMEFLGAQIYTEPSREYVMVSSETLTSKWADALGIVADVVRNASFPEAELDRVRRERLTDLHRISDNPATIASRAGNALLYGLETRYGHPASGTVDSISSLTREDLTRQFARYYGPSNAVMMVVSDLSGDEIVAQVEKNFGGWSGGIAPDDANESSNGAAPRAATIYLSDKPGAAQSIIRTGHLTIPRQDPDFFTLNLLNYIFGGQFSARLNMNLRQDKGYSYGYTSSVNWHIGESALFAGGSVQTEVTKESVAETLKEFADISGGKPVSEEEFTDARDGILRNLPSNFETNSQSLQQLVRIVLFGLPDDYFSQYADKLISITLDDINRAGKDLIKRSELAVLVVGDRQVVEPGLRELGLPMVIVDHDGRPV